jgi:hypothetical protein
MTEEPKSWGGAMWQAHNDSRTKTYRKNFTPKARVYQYALDHVITKHEDDVLDFGCGKDNYWSNRLSAQEYSIDGYDLSMPNATSNDTYSVILVSNVLNVQETEDQLEDTLDSIMRFAKSGTIIVWNYPSGPRKMSLDMDALHEYVKAAAHDGGYTTLTDCLKGEHQGLYVTTLI